MKLFLSHGLYGRRPFSHRDAYHLEPGWAFLELGSWTLEVTYNPPSLRRLWAFLSPSRVGFWVAALATLAALLHDAVPDPAVAVLWVLWVTHCLALYRSSKS